MKRHQQSGFGDEHARLHRMVGVPKRASLRSQASRQHKIRAPSAGTKGFRYQPLPGRRIFRASPCPSPKPAATATAAAAVTATPLTSSLPAFQPFQPASKVHTESCHLGCPHQQNLQVEESVRHSSVELPQKRCATLAEAAAWPSSMEVQVTTATGTAGLRPTVEMHGTAVTFTDGTERPSRTKSQWTLPALTTTSAAQQSSAELQRTATTVSACGQAFRSLEAGELHFTGDTPDLAQPQLLRQLLNGLGMIFGTVEKLAGFQGGLNDGVWLLQEAGSVETSPRDLILKVVSAATAASNLPTEAQNLSRIVKQHPGMLSDPLLAFPTATFSCVSTAKSKTHDLLVMRRARGERLCEVFSRKWHSGQCNDCWAIIEKVGAAAAALHGRYANMQHGDLQPANIFWDEKSACLTLIDIGGMGIPTCNDDMQHFTSALRLLAKSYGSQFESHGVAAFQAGYHANCH